MTISSNEVEVPAGTKQDIEIVEGTTAELYTAVPKVDALSDNNVTFTVTANKAYVKAGDTLELTVTAVGTTKGGGNDAVGIVTVGGTNNKFVGTDGDDIDGTGTTTGVASAQIGGTQLKFTITGDTTANKAINATYKVTVTVTTASDLTITLTNS